MKERKMKRRLLVVQYPADDKACPKAIGVSGGATFVVIP